MSLANSSDRNGWITDMLYKEHITFHEFHTFDNIKYIGDAAARAYTVNSRIYNKPMLMKPIIFNQSFTIQDFVNEVIQHRKVELHDNIIRFYGVTKEDRGQYQYMLLLEHTDEGTLRDYLKKSFLQLKWDVKLKFAKQLVSAVNCLHENDIVHQNLNPEDILIKGGNIKLGGFGLTKKIKKLTNAVSRIYGVYIQYADPEYLKNHQEFIRNKKSDVYSVGVLLWQISSGRVPFEFELPDFSLVQLIIEGKREISIKGTPNKYIDIYTACWEGNLKDRPSIKQVLRNIDEVEITKDVTKGLNYFFKNDISSSRTTTGNDNHVDHDCYILNRKKSISSILSSSSSTILDLLTMYKTKYKNDDNKSCIIIGSSNSSAVDSGSTLVENSNEKNSLDELLSKPGTTLEIKYTLENMNKDINELILQKLLLEFIYQFYISNNKVINSEWLNEFIKNHRGINEHLSSKYLLEMMLNHKNQNFFTNLIGYFYENGIGCDKMDFMKAFEYYLKGSVDDDYYFDIKQKSFNSNFYNINKYDKNSFISLKIILISIGQYFLGLFYYKGINDSIEQDFEKAFEWISKSSENGNLVAQCMLGYFYEHGIGTPENETKAFECYIKSAEGGNACGQCNIGLCYDNGSLGIVQNKYEAFNWYLKAAEGGDSSGQYNLGLCYEEGVGTIKDESKAFEWYLKSAENGNVSGQCKVGVYYEEGMGVEKNEYKAFKWYLKSAEGYDILGQYNLGLCYMKGIGINKDEEEAFNLFLEFAKSGNNLVQSCLGYCYENGIGTYKDESEATKWYLKSTEGGDILTNHNLKLCFKNMKDKDQAFKWYLKFANHGNSLAQYYLGDCFENGLGTIKNNEQALEWYLKSAEGGNEDGQYKVGYYYQNGIGIIKDEQEAFKWYLESAKNGNSKAQSAVGICFMYGIGIKKNIFEAIMWFQKAK
ncbi:kinase-like protein [Rhizophagus irregularis]|uniref:Kinase-like protein n=1 Tax=Rhizophagus irregularis TaxID=588596 RepID=A0A2N1NBC1_9GLOM|nr:kinase-like protein [Rhizophagus irregularis]